MLLAQHLDLKRGVVTFGGGVPITSCVSLLAGPAPVANSVCREQDKFMMREPEVRIEERQQNRELPGRWQFAEIATQRD